MSRSSGRGDACYKWGTDGLACPVSHLYVIPDTIELMELCSRGNVRMDCVIYGPFPSEGRDWIGRELRERNLRIFEIIHIREVKYLN